MLKIIVTESRKYGVSTLGKLANEGARRMIQDALEAEVAAYLERHAQQRSADGRRLVVRNGKGRARRVLCGNETLRLRAPRVNDRRVNADGTRRRFTSRILPPYKRRSLEVANALPHLYLRSLSTGDFRPVLKALFGGFMIGLPAKYITKLTERWAGEFRRFHERRLLAEDYLYVSAVATRFDSPVDDWRSSVLALIGTRSDEHPELLTVGAGSRENAESWKPLIRGLRYRGMGVPAAAVGPGALGFWPALREIWPESDQTRAVGSAVVDGLARRVPEARRLSGVLTHRLSGSHGHSEGGQHHATHRAVTGDPDDAI